LSSSKGSGLCLKSLKIKNEKISGEENSWKMEVEVE